jgi:transposase InsO family protein
MATENRWGAPRMHGELSKLGFRVSERTVSRYLRKLHPRGRRDGQTWKTFLANHREVLAAMDFLVVPTATFRLLYVLVIVHHDRRRVLHCNVTEHPTSTWVSQQLREAFPEETAPKYFLMDNYSIFSTQVTCTVESFGTKVIRTGFQSPWMNGVCERLIGSIRRELLDHVIVLSENHLRRLIRSFLDYYHDDRTHLTLGKDCPAPRTVTPRPSHGAKVVALPRVGGLHHRYQWRHAA